MSDNNLCSYVSPEGIPCRQEAEDSGKCFWHDPSIDKRDHSLSKELEQLARSGASLHGLLLKEADLKEVNLVKRGSDTGYDLSYSDLYHAHLNGAHLFNLKLQNGSLMKANLAEANLHLCSFENTNLLGVKWGKARIDGMRVGQQISQERKAEQAYQKGDLPKAIDNFEQSEEIYRDLRKLAETQGLFEEAGHFLCKELTMRRFQFPLYSRRRIQSKLIDLFCGYGERPLNVIVFSLLLIFTSAICYFFLGVSANNEVIGFNSELSVETNMKYFFNSIYYSVVTFTTLGYGDITPVGASRFVAALEAFIGSFTLALFVVVFVKKMTR
ncbi:ion channel [Kiloniella sp.]|uniref:ion channel n=1 Tax=Kiloniella sp. TaxID=1938587 RepID=UPI003B01591D